MNRPLPLPAALRALLLLSSILAIGCRVDRDAFAAKVFPCNPNAPNPACGTDGDGERMACFATYQLGGRNFCAPSCDSATASFDGDDPSICLPAGAPGTGRLSGARLATCDPASSGEPCGPDLSCLRTDLYKDEGVCLNISLCARHADCRDPVRSVCMGQLLAETYNKAEFSTAHAYCLQGGCRANRTACLPGEVCLRDVIPRESRPADICVPNCDSNQNCPPNYFCYPKLYSRPAPPVCVPGLLGLRCKSRIDCLVGDCVDTGAGYNVCTTSCEDDNDCAKLDSEQGTFFCATREDGRKFCQGARAYTGGFCHTSEDCRPGEMCSWISTTARTGYCQQPCGPDGACRAYGGVAHTCLPQVTDPTTGASKGPPACFPGSFGVPCQSDPQCLGPNRGGSRDLYCKPVAQGVSICTALCQNDQDCRSNRFTKEGWCPAAEGQASVCLPALADGVACQRDAQCISKKCLGNKCDATPGF